jgi:periplasmic protein TonB
MIFPATQFKKLSGIVLLTICALLVPGCATASGPESIKPASVASKKIEYPLLARANDEEGIVVVKIQIKANGSVGNVDLVKSSGFSRLDRAAVDGVRTFEYLPETRNGVPVDSKYQMAIAFRLLNSKPEHTQ